MINLGLMTYHILGRNNLEHEEIPLRNEIHAAWEKLWTETYRSVDPNYLLKVEELERQDLIGCIQIDGRVAAAHLYSFYHLDSEACRKTHYFEFFNDRYFDALRSRNVRTAMSMEYLTVMPEFRKSYVGFSLAHAIAQLGCFLWENTGADALIAPARTDVKVSDMAYDLGFTCIEKGTPQRGFDCDLTACFRGDLKPTSNPDVNLASESLWERKIVHASARAYIAPSRNLRLVKAA